MERIALTAFMSLHGIIHLIGFSKEWKLGPGGRPFGKTLITLNDQTSKLVGLLWLASCIVMMATAYFYFEKKDWYWIPGVIGLTISQALIVLYWHDAKYGTIANVILLFIVVIGAGYMSHNKMVKKEIQSIINKPFEQKIITEHDIAHLPNPVQRWLTTSGVIGTNLPKYVRVVQSGSMRTKPGSDWMPFTAEQHFTVHEPAFIWNATINPFLIPIAGRDKFSNGHGNMLIKPLYIYRMADQAGPEIDQGTLLRYIAEIIWIPQAVVCDYLSWEPVDNNHARVTMNDNGLSASGTYTFSNKGDVIGFEALRYGDFNGEYRQEIWSITIGKHQTYQGIRTGRTSEVTWKLKSGDFQWLKLEILDINYIYEK